MDVGGWLRNLGLGQYEPAFIENAIDIDVLPELTEGDLEKLGMTLGDRKRLHQGDQGDGWRPCWCTHQQRSRQSRRAIYSPMAAAERRHLTVMICDLVDSTALSARLDPEDMRAVMDAFHAACARITLSYDGFLADFRGDGILAYFGYPRAHEDDAERTVRAALDIAAAVARLKTPAAGAALGPHWHRHRLGARPRPRWRGCIAGAFCVGDAPNTCSPPSGPGRAWDGRRRRLDTQAARRPLPPARSWPAQSQGHCRAGRGVGG